MFVRVLRAQHRALPLDDVASAVPLSELAERVGGVGQGVQTADELKEAKSEFSNHMGRIRDMIAFVKRAGADIKDRQQMIANRKVREFESVKEKARKEAENVIEKAERDKQKKDEKERTKEKAQKKVAEQDVAGYLFVNMQLEFDN